MGLGKYEWGRLWRFGGGSSHCVCIRPDGFSGLVESKSRDVSSGGGLRGF